MPDLSPQPLQEEQTVTMTIPEEAVMPESNPQPAVEPTPQVLSTTNPQENVLPKPTITPGNDNIVVPTQEQIMVKIQCNKCKEILNSQKDFEYHDKTKHTGAPCKFCENKVAVLKTAKEYLDKCYTSKPQQIPFVEELALLLDVTENTIGNWANKKIPGTEQLEHPDFLGIYAKLKTIQKLFLSKRILGRYNPTGAIGLLKWHHGMIETEKRILAGDKDAAPITIKIVEEKPIKNE